MKWDEAYKELKNGKCIHSEFWDQTVYIKICGPMKDVDYHIILLCYSDEPESQDWDPNKDNNQWIPAIAEFDGEWEIYKCQ
jgi:hypothetical protein